MNNNEKIRELIIKIVHYSRSNMSLRVIDNSKTSGNEMDPSFNVHMYGFTEIHNLKDSINIMTELENPLLGEVIKEEGLKLNIRHCVLWIDESELIHIAGVIKSPIENIVDITDEYNRFVDNVCNIMHIPYNDSLPVKMTLEYDNYNYEVINDGIGLKIKTIHTSMQSEEIHNDEFKNMNELVDAKEPVNEIVNSTTHDYHNASKELLTIFLTNQKVIQEYKDGYLILSDQLIDLSSDTFKSLDFNKLDDCLKELGSKHGVKHCHLSSAKLYKVFDGEYVGELFTIQGIISYTVI